MRTDEQLMVDYGHGDEAAFEQLARRYWQPAFGFIRRIVGNDAVAEEVVSEAFFKLHRAAGSYEPNGRFSTFLFTIAYREAISMLRKVRRRDRAVGAIRDAGMAVPAATGGAEEDPFQALRTQRALAQLDRVLSELPEAQKAAFVLYYRTGASIPEIAKILELKQGSVRAYLTLVRNALRVGLEEPVLADTTAAGTLRGEEKWNVKRSGR